MIKKITSILLLGTLAFSSIGMSFASNLTKIDYSKDLIKGLGFEVQSASSAYKRETTENEDIIYTAFQLGLLKNVSWDFETPMTDVERETILANAMEIYDQKKDKNIKVDNKEKHQEEAVIQSPKIQRNYQTPYGTIKTPSKDILKGLWTDEAFHQYLINERENGGVFEPLNMYYEEVKEHGGIHYYDTQQRKFFVKHPLVDVDENGELVYSYTYLEMDEEAHALLFKTMKTAYFLANKYDLDISIGNYSERVRVKLSDAQTYTSDLALFIGSEVTRYDKMFYKVDAYDPSVNKISMEWNIGLLWDNNLYSEYGVDLMDDPHEEIERVHKESSFSQQKYTDIFYAMCQSIHGEDADDVYYTLMSEYLYENSMWAFEDVDTEKYEKIELKNHNIYIDNPVQYQTFYGIEVK